MSFWSNSFIYRELSKKTSIFGLRLWLVICVVAGATIVLLLFLLTICCTSCRRRRRIPQQKIAPKQQQLKPQLPQPPTLDPLPPSKEIHQQRQQRQQQQHNLAEVQIEIGKHESGGGPRAYHHHRRQQQQPPPPPPAEVQIKIEKHEHSDGPRHHGVVSPEVPHLGWGHCYTMRELEEATGDFAEENVIGEGGYGVVYRGVLADNTVIAVKKLLDNRGQAEKEFRVEVEAIGRVRHKHLVSLLGYCAEGEHRMLVYEYVDNGNLEQWLYGDVGEVSPLTWEIRMNILLGTAKGLAYLHEGLEPKVVHRDVKASNILIDQQWNSKISDFGLAKLLGPERTHVTTRVMGTFGYVAPEYASSGMLNERSDVYSFGVLIMEVITGRTPVDYRRPKGEVHLVEWLKTMIGDRRSEEVADPKLPEKPSSKALKRALLVALQCVDPDSKMRPKMGSVIHMLEMDDSLIRNDLKVGRQSPSFQRDYNRAEERRFQKYDVSSTSR